MASSTADQSRKDQTPEPSGASTGNNGHPSPEMGYPPAMGYPPQMGYTHGLGHGHPTYPPQQYQPYSQTTYNSYTYAQPPPATYYSNQSYQSNRLAAFIRGIIAAIVLVIAIMFVSTIVTWIVLRPEIPIFTVESFSVSKFNISKPNYSVTWDYNVTVENPNQKLKVSMNRIQTFVNCRDVTMASSAAEPFLMDKKTKSSIIVSTSMNDAVVQIDSNMAEEMARQRGTGMVTYSLRMLVRSTFKSDSLWMRHITMKVFCGDLSVAFVGSSNSGVLSGGKKPRNCIVYV